MARKAKRRGGGRRRGTTLTPKNILIAAPTLLGTIAAAKQVYTSYTIDKDMLHATTGIIARNGTVTLDKAVPIGIVTDIGGGILASKVIKGGLNLAGKQVPVANRLLNLKIAKI